MPRITHIYLTAPATVTVVDVRDPKEFSEGHVPGAINIPVESFAAGSGVETGDQTFYHGVLDRITMRFDLHVHTVISPCSDLRIDDILSHAKDRGLDGVCITDHNTMEIKGYLKEGLQEDGLCVLFGMEYGTPDGDFLIFGPFEDIPTGLPPSQLLKIVEQNGGAAVAAHPFRSGRSVREDIVSGGLCRIVESINGRNAERENENVDSWRRRFVLSECGGSDAHSLHELGKVVTCFDAPVRSREDLIHALGSGLCRPEWNIPTV